MIIHQGRHRARKLYKCNRAIPDPEECKRLIEPGDQYRRVFGMADRLDSPYVVRFCVVCADIVKFGGEAGKAHDRR